jgi:hypothetical protein
MRTFVYMITSIVFLYLLLIGVNVITHYHTTQQGALKELIEKVDGQVIPLSSHNYTFVIHKNGGLSIAHSYVFYPLGWYKDFTVYPSELNVYEAIDKHDMAYAIFPHHLAICFGYTTNPNVQYAVYLPKKNAEKHIREDGAIGVISLADYIDDPKAKNIKLWYVYAPLEKQAVPRNIFFLDQNKEIVEVDDKK